MYLKITSGGVIFQSPLMSVQPINAGKLHINMSMQLNINHMVGLKIAHGLQIFSLACIILTNTVDHGSTKMYSNQLLECVNSCINVSVVSLKLFPENSLISLNPVSI
jgi:hypothetical protein